MTETKRWPRSNLGLIVECRPIMDYVVVKQLHSLAKEAVVEEKDVKLQECYKRSECFVCSYLRLLSQCFTS